MTERTIGKRITFDPETYAALDLYAKDSMRSLQELADEAFVDLLKKHHRPTSLKAALRDSARDFASNDNARNVARQTRHRESRSRRKRP
jgi:hypothetical protein